MVADFSKSEKFAIFMLAANLFAAHSINTHTPTLVASVNFGKFRPKGEFNYSSSCSPASPHWLRGLGYAN